ncbi:tetratricopeptide repeat protein [Leptospira interrogans serovar Bataviae str. UI 08561]|nr:tetratricopeptide repeat protein [Leptospira interrogans serovar Bataviae str. UI 08561]
MDLISKLLTQIEKFILSAPLGEFSEQEIHEIRHKKIVDRLTQGWEYLKKKEYSKVQELLNSIFAAYEKDGEALFLDARLLWLKSGSAEEGMKRAEKNLLLASNGDRLGRGRLHNLIGCALDELGKWEEALLSFQKAEELSLQDSIYVTNLAEIFWKLGNKTSAGRYAKKAKSMGNQSEIVETIFRETTKNSPKE